MFRRNAITDNNIMAKMLDNLPERFRSEMAASVLATDQQNKANLKKLLIQAESRMTSAAENEQALAESMKKMNFNHRPPNRESNPTGHLLVLVFKAIVAAQNFNTAAKLILDVLGHFDKL